MLSRNVCQQIDSPAPANNAKGIQENVGSARIDALVIQRGTGTAIGAETFNPVRLSHQRQPCSLEKQIAGRS